MQREIDLGGYFVIVTPRKMTEKDALELYKSRDTSEKLFLGDKSYLGNGALRVQSDEKANAIIFAEFVALRQGDGSLSGTTTVQNTSISVM